MTCLTSPPKEGSLIVQFARGQSDIIYDVWNKSSLEQT